MGHYTDYRAELTLSANTPADVKWMLQYLTWTHAVNDAQDPADDEQGIESEAEARAVAFNHPFFNTRRWASIGLASNNNLDLENPVPVSERFLRLESGDYRLKITSSTKGSEEDLALFVAWLHPWLVVKDQPRTLPDGRVVVGVAQHEFRREYTGYNDEVFTARLVLADEESVGTVLYCGAPYQYERDKGVVESFRGFNVEQETLDDVNLAHVDCSKIELYFNKQVLLARED